MTKCAYCEYNDGAVYTSYPPKYRCTVTGEYHLALDDCDVEFAPVKHGRWIDAGDSKLHCTNCHRFIRRIIPIGYDYCPHCGAKMDEVEE